MQRMTGSGGVARRPAGASRTAKKPLIASAASTMPMRSHARVSIARWMKLDFVAAAGAA